LLYVPRKVGVEIPNLIGSAVDFNVLGEINIATLILCKPTKTNIHFVFHIHRHSDT
jgi:hypothetical protein